MADQYGLVYGTSLIVGGLFGFFFGGSIISLVLGGTLGAWSLYNALHPSRQNGLANVGIAVVLAVVMLLRYSVSGKWFPALAIVALSAGQIFRNYPHLISQPKTKKIEKAN